MKGMAHFHVPMRWGTQGMWHDNSRRRVNAGATSPDGRYVAIVDESGDVEVFKHPADPTKIASSISASSHSTHATCVRFAVMVKDYILSVGEIGF